MKVAVYGICKNEMKYLERWYNSVKTADYICLLDTGSTDGTWEKLQTLPNVICKQQIFTPFSFGQAKTEAYKLVPADTDICVTIDLDEYFYPENWVDLIKLNFKNQPIRCIYFAGDDGNQLTSKYIAHPYVSDLIWKHPIFEEPAYRVDDHYQSYWNFFTIPYTPITEITVYHTKDHTKGRHEYDQLIRDKIEECFFTIRQKDTTYEETMELFYSVIEALNAFPHEYEFYLREAVRLLALRHFERTQTQWVGYPISREDLNFLYLMQEGHKILGELPEACSYSLELLKNTSLYNKEIWWQIPLQDAVPALIAMHYYREAYQIIICNIFNTLQITSPLDLLRLKMAINSANFFTHMLQRPKFFPSLEAKTQAASKELQETHSFKAFQLKKPVEMGY